MTEAPTLYKYPRTRHLQGSRLQQDDFDLDQVPLEDLRGRFTVIEEKVDGANCAVSFSPSAGGAQLLLQSRGHFLDGGGLGEDQFSLFKAWGHSHAGWLYELLGRRYVLYGEWLHKKHTVAYDRLDHYFMEFDVWDAEAREFLSTARRRELLNGTPIVSVPVLQEGEAPRRKKDLVALIGESKFQTRRWREWLEEEVRKRGFDLERVMRQTDQSGLSEGLYVKVEEGGRVVDRLKYVRWTFLDAVKQAGSHVNDYPMIPNRLKEGVDIFARP